MSILAERAPVTVAELVAAVRDQQVTVTGRATRPEPSTVMPSTLVVVAAHPGCGASVLAVALADVLSQSGVAVQPVHLVDLAAPEQSGMASAAACEIGSQYDDWRAARRGAVTMLRPAIMDGSPTAVPALPEIERGRLVLDPGRPWTDLAGLANAMWELARREHVLVVCRATVPGVRRAELALAALDRPVVVAAVGARRWPREVEASFGPRLADIVGSGRAVLVPADRSVEINGVTAAPFHKPIATAAACLAALIWPAESQRDKDRTKGLHG